MNRISYNFYFWAIVINLSFGHQLFGQNEALLKGNESFKRGEYQDALNEYIKVENSNFGGFGLFSNMAKAYALLKDDPKAILYYEKALKINPNDKTIKNELNAVLKRNPEIEVGFDDIIVLKMWRLFTGWITPDKWAYLTLILLFLSGIVYLFNNQFVPIKKHIKVIMLSFFGMFLVSIIAAGFSYNQWYRQQFMIIIHPKVQLKMGPDDLSPDLNYLPQGTKVRKKDSLGQWVNVLTPYGDAGWIKTIHVAKI